MARRYRPEVDGLRAIAVLAVIFYHFALIQIPSGFLGVDVFFVISGYLITGNIEQDISSGTFKFKDFYARRARRILPVLYTVIICCLPFSWIWMFPTELREFAKSIIAVVLFSSNFYFYTTIGYFSPNVETMPLIHTWSLAVEEQFYLFFPIFMWLLRAAEFKKKLTLLLFLTTTSLSATVWLAEIGGGMNFYLLPSRIFELGIGAIAATLSPHLDVHRHAIRQSLATLGAVSIIVSFFIFGDATSLPGFWSLLPTLGTALVILFASEATLCGKILTLRPVVAVGRLSYSAYLWHQPVFSFYLLRFGQSKPVYSVLLLLLTLFISYFSYRYIELPFRNKESFSRNMFIGLAPLFAALLIIFGGVIESNKGFVNRWKEENVSMETWRNEPIPRERECVGTDSTFVPPDKACIYNAVTMPEIAIWGDSHAAVLTNAIAEALAPIGKSLKQYAMYSCPPVLDVYTSPQNRTACPRFNQIVFDAILSDPNIKVVILSARWQMYTNGSYFNNGEGGVTGTSQGYAVMLRLNQTGMNGPQPQEFVSQLDAEITKLVENGKKVVLIAPIPEVGWRVPDRMEREIFRFGAVGRPQISTSYAVFLKRTESFTRNMIKLSVDPRILIFSPSDIVCNNSIANRCVAELNAIPIYKDDNHLSSFGSKLTAQMLLAKLTAAHFLE